jgi:hypothetical protein
VEIGKNGSGILGVKEKTLPIACDVFHSLYTYRHNKLLSLIIINKKVLETNLPSTLGFV